MKSFRTVIALILVTACAGPVMGQAAPPGRTTAPTQVGAVPVPRGTFIQTMDAEFKRIDADRNNVLTKKEIEDAQRAVAVLDAQRRNAAVFQALDKDKNGVLSPGEFATLGARTPPPNAAPVLAQTDGNRDGSVTLVEYRAGKLVNFDLMDTDKDGIVSPAEMKAAGIIK